MADGQGGGFWDHLGRHWVKYYLMAGAGVATFMAIQFTPTLGIVPNSNGSVTGWLANALSWPLQVVGAAEITALGKPM